MRHPAAAVVLVVVMIALIIGLDVAFLRDRFGLRLAVNVGIVALAAIVYVTVIRD